MSHQAAFLEATTSDQIQSFLDTNKVAVIMLYAPYIGPAARASPFASNKSNQTGVALIKVNVDKAQYLAQYFNIIGMPDFVVVKDQWNNIKKSRLWLKIQIVTLAISLTHLLL